MFGLGQKHKPPAALLAALGPDEHLLGAASDIVGNWLAATRLGIWKLPVGQEPKLISWSLISKATWQAPILQLVRADVVGELAGAELIEDRRPFNYELAHPSKITDVIHSRIRAGIISSEHHALPQGGAWVVIRRVPGQDGATAQIRLDPGTDPGSAAEWLEPVVAQALAPFRALD